MSFNSKTSTNVLERTDITEIKPWRVIMHNDNVTTWEIVMYILVNIFDKAPQEAHELTMKVDREGAAVVAQLDYEMAEQKVFEATTFARSNGAPLVITIEQ
jgi:ATP-dependent Clp protease adaptor protein ClpS